MRESREEPMKTLRALCAGNVRSLGRIPVFGVMMAAYTAVLVGLFLAVPAVLSTDGAAAQNAKKSPKAQASKSAPPAITDDDDDPAVWGKLFPRQYELYLKTADMQRTKYGGSEALPRTPTQADPRSVVAISKVEEDIGLRMMWQGYAFAVDFREERGHAHMLEDQTFTQRQQVVAQPGACLNCHASTYVANKKAGDGDIFKGFEKMNAMPYRDALALVKHPVSCIDCHDATTLALRVTRPAFIEGMRAYKASQGVQDYDVNKQATQQEMRAYVCGQCHVEYYFRASDKRLIYPWAKGIKVEQIQAYYDELGFRDWTHKDTGAPALKAQHPEFELWSQGLHARAGVTCSDCHMPKVQYKGATVSDHWVRSPVLNIKSACLGCHQKHDAKVTEKELKGRIEQIQDRHWDLRQIAMTAMIGLIGDLKAAKDAGKPDSALATARYLQRRAQFYLDFVEAENSTGFHAPQEAARILGEALNYARQGQLAVRDPSFTPTVQVVDIPPPAPPVPAQAPAQTPAPAPR
jgi:nitrite reductase (cytochrome c-552)